MMKAEVISIGDELLAGLTINHNAAFIAEKLIEIGMPVRWITTVGDHEKDLLNAMDQAGQRADVIIMTGGLGPTHDDISRNVVATFLNSKLVLQEDVLRKIESVFRKRGKTMAPTNRIQAKIPEKAAFIENPVGTAPGIQFEKNGHRFYLLPGVPSEMKNMMIRKVLPLLQNNPSNDIFMKKMLRTVGIAESDLYEKILDFPKKFSEVRLAFLPNPSGIVMRLTTRCKTKINCEQVILEAERYIRHRVGCYIYGEGDNLIEKTIIDLLQEHQKTIAVAESCTGGLIASKLTNIPGSSSCFERGVVAYSNTAKIDILGVSETILKKHGAVSAETAEAMAQGIKHISGTDIGISTTGIAGPSGGTKEKPVGLVYIGYVDDDQTLTEKHRFTRDRLWNKERFAMTALDMVRRNILGHPYIWP